MSEHRAAVWMAYAATPVFAGMAVLTARAGAPPDGLCSATHATTFAGMAPMYGLMSVFHAAPWMALAARWRTAFAG